MKTTFTVRFLIGVVIFSLATPNSFSQVSGVFESSHNKTASTQNNPNRIQGSAPITVTIDASQRSWTYSSNFVGLSFETGALKLNNGTTGYTFDTSTTRSPKCQEVTTLLKNIGVENLRIGGSTVDQLIPPNDPGYQYSFDAIDALFSAVSYVPNLKVIYSLRLLGSSSYDPQNAAANIASHIWNRNQAELNYFAIGNEPNWKSYHYPPAGTGPDPEIVYYKTSVPDQGYIEEWKEFAAAVTTSVPSASFGGPDTGDENGGTSTWWNGESWTQNFINDKKSGNITVPIIAATQHNYVGGSAPSSATTAIDSLLGRSWASYRYPQLYNQILTYVAQDGWHYRFTECNDYLGGTSGASDRFAAALWALDYMHWQSAHSQYCSGVNFHNKFGNTTCVIYRDANGDYQAYPRADALKMYTLGGNGQKMTSWSVSNPSNANVDIWPVGTSTDLYITIINKTSQYVGDWTAANVTITPSNFTASSAEYIVMNSYPTTKDVTSSGASVGGASINNSGTWNGTWTPLTVSGSGQCTLSVTSASAAIIHIHGMAKVSAETFGSSNTDTNLPKEFFLDQNYPNPFNPTTRIDYQLQSDSYVILKVYDSIGEVVGTLVNGQMNAGAHSVLFNAANLSSGVYFYRIQAGNYSAMKKLILLK